MAEHRLQTHKYKCPDCDKIYKLSKDIRKHNRQAHIENVKMTCCKFCDKVFHDSSLKTGHISTFHADLEGSTNNEIQVKEEMGITNKIQIKEGLGITNEIQIKEETESSNEMPIKAQMGSINAGTIEEAQQILISRIRTNAMQIKEEVIGNQKLNLLEEQKISNENLDNVRSSSKRLIKNNSYYRDFQL